MRIEKLIPAFKDYLWGGNKLKEKYGKNTDIYPCAESWEFSVHKDGPSLLTDGKTLLEALSEAELGSNIKNFDIFPMLIKFIDAAKDLSIQVHPSDAYALENENSLGKTELWYVMEAEEGAGIYIGFNAPVTKYEYEKAIRENRLCNLLTFKEVKAGDFYFIPAGTVHAIGKGCLICEIQQNSNITYRVYDYARIGKDGKPRELHVEKALDVSTLDVYKSPFDYFSEDGKRTDGTLLGKCEYFESRLLEIQGTKSIALDKTSFRVVCCVGGEGYIGGVHIKAADSFFVSACDETLELRGDMSVIVSLVPNK